MDLREAQRLAALKAYKVLDTPADAAIDRLADLAGNLFDTPISLVSLVDEERQWFKAKVGLDAPSTPRSDAFCAHAIAMGPEAVLVVEDATQDPRFAANPLVTGAPDIRFYAGATLTTKDGHNLGTLCVIDDKPRARPAETDLERLKLLARIVVDEFELAKAQRQTAEKQRLLELAESVAAIGHWRIDIATNHLTWSDQTFQIFGLSRDSYTPTIDSSLTHYSPAHRAVLEQGIEQAIAKKGGFDLQVQLIRASGEVRDVMARGLCELDDHGEVCALFGLLQDVTDYSNAMRAVEATGERYRLLTENANDLVTRMGLDGRFSYVSPAVRAISGYAPEEAVGRLAMEFIHPEDRARVAEIFNSALYGPPGWSIEYRIVRKDGSVRWVEARPRLTHDPVTGVPNAVTDVIRDITDRKVIDDALADSEARYRLMADNASDMISRLDAKGAITFMSPACKPMLGFKPEELMGRRVIDLTYPEDVPSVLAYYAALIAAGPGAVAEPLQFRGRKRDGQWLWLEGQPTLFFDEAGKMTGVQDVIRDISSRKAMEEALEAARNEAEAAANVKAEFLSNMSHELRTPLTAVLGFSRLIAEQPELTDATRRYVERVSSAGKALLSTVNDILDFSKLEAGQVEIVHAPAAPAALVAETLDLFTLQAGEKGVALRSQGLAALPASLNLAADRVRQILLNLVGNAVKFTDQGEVAVEASYADGRLRLAVRDTGAGIPADRLSALFVRFSQVDGSSTRRHGGTGLGLAICKGLVEAMGGEIGVESTVGKGSCFWFELPAAVIGAPVAATTPERTTDCASGCRVLVVDDNPVNRDLVSAVLRGLSVEMTEAGDGAQALAIAQTRAFDLILMDQRMPIMDGEAAARRIRDGDGPNRTTPMIAFSADGTTRIDERLFDGLLGKPLDPAALLRGVASVMIRRGISAAA
ncbi:PAS domain S-box protein [Caulobacter sp.]|uniref:PAS domain S-box protein n=1 Tax=Caulobacter sp. TaxID=78 RepID=UPI001B1B06BA|nr:PAS domain S-box protein [Caulobacter sp.]MBO9547021.1 PAS domain S-box protein [Caulobacter sp.]